MATAPSLCFQCDQNPRAAGDFLCRSCKEEHKYCYECGERERNHPFKLCTQCYQGSRRTSGPTAVATAARTAPHQKILVRLGTDQNTYKELAKHFIDEWVKLSPAKPKPPDPIAIYAIQNAALTQKFHYYGERIRQGGTASNSDLFFHGTKITCNLLATDECCTDSECGICGISRYGFDASRIGSNIPRFKRFGAGIYLAPNSSKCHDYTQGVEEYGVRAQLLCLVACGAKHELMYDNTKLATPPPNFHSVYGRSGGSLNYDEIVVYDADAVLPQYAVVYERDGVIKIAN